MKILYSAGNRSGANSQLERILKHISPKHEIRIAAYLKSSTSIPHVDWLLDSLHNNLISLRGKKYIWELFTYGKTTNKKRLTTTDKYLDVPKLNYENSEIFINEVMDYFPDLIISDGEFVSGLIANLLNIRLWYCSPLHLLDGINWGHKKYQNDLGYFSLLQQQRKLLKYTFPKAEQYLVYSPFCGIMPRPFLKPGYKWVKPYHTLLDCQQGDSSVAFINDDKRYNDLKNILKQSSNKFQIFKDYNEDYKKALRKSNNFYFCTGETSSVADAFYNKKLMLISPNLEDPESLINAILVRLYNAGNDFGKLEYMEKYALSTLENKLNRKYNDDYIERFSLKKHSYLHELIEEI
jgi:hypothetical protein